MTYYDIIKIKQTQVPQIEDIILENNKKLLTTSSFQDTIIGLILGGILSDTIYLKKIKSIYSCVAYKISDYNKLGIDHHVFSFEQGPLGVGILYYLMDSLNLKDPFDILRYNINNTELMGVINDLVYSSNSGIFYGIYNPNVYSINSLIEGKKKIIHKLKIEENNIEEAIDLGNISQYEKDNIKQIFFLSKPLFILKKENGELVQSNNTSWSFFLTKEHVENSIEKIKEKLIVRLMNIVDSHLFKIKQGEIKITKDKEMIKDLIKNLKNKTLIK